MTGAEAVAALLESTAEGYGRAFVERSPCGEGSPSGDLFGEMLAKGLPVLAECSGVLGVLRGLDHPGRRRGVLRELAESGEFVAVAFWTPAAPRVVHWWRVRVKPAPRGS